jgi:hypothetical protein
LRLSIALAKESGLRSRPAFFEAFNHRFNEYDARVKEDPPPVIGREFSMGLLIFFHERMLGIGELSECNKDDILEKTLADLEHDRRVTQRARGHPQGAEAHLGRCHKHYRALFRAGEHDHTVGP